MQKTEKKHLKEFNENVNNKIEEAKKPTKSQIEKIKKKSGK